MGLKPKTSDVGSNHIGYIDSTTSLNFSKHKFYSDRFAKISSEK